MGVYSDNSKQYLQELVRLAKTNLTAIGYEKLVVAGTAVALTVPATAKYAEIVLQSSITTPAIRFLLLGAQTLPTSAEGIPRSDLDAFDIYGYNNLINFRAIQVAGGTHTLFVQYYS